MRFINTITLELEDHLETIPRYAILSHTWGDEEVTLQDWSNPTIRNQLVSLLNELENENAMRDGTQEPLRVAQLNGAQIESDDYYWRRRLGLNCPIDSFGYWKILNTCLQARKDGLGHLWVDTNCIDKTSSAELSEAINSMYTWYRNSSICYAYLSDVQISDPTYTATYLATGKSISNLHGSSLDSFRKSRWFRRGWTLQELLAPRKVCFYSRTWTPIGTKKDMAPLLAELTRVGERYLLYAEDIRSASIAQRMAAVADRTTTRPEDIAYCLLGLFNVNMPLLYGEGAMAFVRLQEEIMKVSDDHSIFAWTWIAELTGGTSFKTVAARLGRLSLDHKPNFPTNRLRMLLHNLMRRDATRPTLLAPDPACFFDASAVPALKPPGSLGIFTMTNVGLSVSLPILGHLCGKLFFAVLHVNHNSGDDTMTVIMIPLARHFEHQDRWTRTPFPVAPVTAVLRNRVGLALKLETIQACRDVQHVPFYFNAFGGTSHPFGFWLFFPRVRELSRAGLHLDDGCVLGNGAYNTHGVFFKPDNDRWRQLVGGLLIFHMQDAWSQWHDKIILLFLCLEVKKSSDGILRKKSHHCKISIQPRAPIDAPQLLGMFVAHVQKHIDDGGQSTYMCDDSFKQRFRGFGEHSPLGYQNFTLHASAEFLNDEPLSCSHRSEITLTELNLWSSGKRAKTFDQFGENPLREDTRMTF